MLRNNISFGGGSGGYISLDPESTSVKFPAYIDSKRSDALNLKVLGSTDFSFNIKSCSAKTISLVDQEVLHIPGR